MEERIPEIADRVIPRWNGMVNSVLLSFQDEYHRREGLQSDLHITGIGGELMRPALMEHPEKVSGQGDIVRIFERRLRVNKRPRRRTLFRGTQGYRAGTPAGLHQERG
ncbi:MAG: hypothetical protein L6427_12685 [Actinomycetia bacterium]|nr:hypothetical protein [Actinomycetes bacterium]